MKKYNFLMAGVVVWYVLVAVCTGWRADDDGIQGRDQRSDDDAKPGNSAGKTATAGLCVREAGPFPFGRRCGESGEAAGLFRRTKSI